MSKPILVTTWWPTNSPYAVQAPEISYEGDPEWHVKYGTAGLLKQAKDRGTCRLIANGTDGYLWGRSLDPADLLPGGKRGLLYPRGVARSKAHFEALCGGWKAAGVELTHVEFDDEGGPGYWSSDVEAVVAHESYPALAAKYGLPTKPLTQWNDADKLQYHSGATTCAQEQLYEGVHGVFVRHWPKLKWSNWNIAPNTIADAKLSPDPNCQAGYYPPTRATAYSPGLYATPHMLRRASRDATEYGVRTGDYAPVGWTWVPGLKMLTSYQLLVWSLREIFAVRRRVGDAVDVYPCTCAQEWSAKCVHSEHGPQAPVLSHEHLHELRLHGLLNGNGNLQDWAGDQLTPEQYAANDAALHAACEAYLAVTQGRKMVRVRRTEMPSDRDPAVVSVVEYAGGLFAGRVTWADDKTTSYPVSVGGKAVTVQRNGREPGTSFSRQA